MRAFTLLKETKDNHERHGKGVIRVWLHKYSGNILQEFCYPTYHTWKVDGSTANLRFWVNEFYKHPKKVS